MKPLTIIYWSRVSFGVLAAAICVLLRIDQLPNPLISGISMGIIVYILTYYVLKWLFITKVEKPSKIFTMGIGAYFITWIVAWGLLQTVIFH